MKHDALIRHLGPQIAHVTARSNVPLIKSYGLMPAAVIARAAGVDPAKVLLRDQRLVVKTPFGGVTLNHQNPINHGRSAAKEVLDGHTPGSWATQLDERVFFSRVGPSNAFEKSIAADLPTATLYFDTVAMLEHLANRLELCPINSGNFLQGGAKAQRGDWIYTKVNEGFETFCTKRQKRGLIKGRDSVKELSIKDGISVETLSRLNMRVQ